MAASPISAGVMTVVPAYTGKITFAFVSTPEPPAIIPAQAGMPQYYYRPVSSYIVSLSGLKNASGVLFSPGVDSTAYATVVNHITGAVTQSSTALTNGVAGAFSGTLPVAGFPAGGPLRLTATVYDQTGSAGPVCGSFEALLYQYPLMELQYRRNALNRLLITGLTGPTGALLTSANTTVYVTLADAYTRASIQAQTPMTYAASPGAWFYDKTPWSGEPVVLMAIDVYDNTGSGGTHYAQFSYLVYRGL